MLEGLNRNPGIHAAGVLITPSPLVEHLPLYQSTKGDITTQFDMRMSEEMGLLKMDFLGLRTLTVIDKALKLIAETTARERPSPSEIPTTTIRSPTSSCRRGAPSASSSSSPAACRSWCAR